MRQKRFTASRADARNPTHDARGFPLLAKERVRVRSCNDRVPCFRPSLAPRSVQNSSDATRPDISSPHLASPGGRGKSSQASNKLSASSTRFFPGCAGKKRGSFGAQPVPVLTTCWYNGSRSGTETQRHEKKVFVGPPIPFAATP